MLHKFALRRNEAGDGDGGGAPAGDGGGGAPAGDGGLLGADGVGSKASVGSGDLSEAGGQPGVTFPENWKDAIAEEYRNEPALNNVPDIPTLVKNYIHAQKGMGKKGVHLPDQHSTDDDRRAFFQQMGLPASLETYELAKPKDMSFEDGFLTQFKEAAFGANILPNQAEQILSWYNEANAAAMQTAITQEQANMQEDLKQLKNEWGIDYDQNMTKARAVLRTIGDEQVNSWLENSGLDNSAMMMRLMSQIGSLMKEDNVIDLGDNVGPSSKDIQSRIQELEGNTKGPLYDRHHPNHHQAVKEKDQLYRQLYPEQQ